MICGLEWPLLFLECTTIKSLSLWTIWFLNWLTLLWKRDSLTTCVHFPQSIDKKSCKQHIWGSSKLVRKQHAVMWKVWGRIQISFMSLRRKSIPESRFFATSTMRHPLTFTPPRQRKHSFSGRASAGVISSSADGKLLPSRRRSNSLGGKDHDLSPSKLDFQSFKKRPSLLGSKLKLGSKEADHAVSNRTEKHSIVMLGAGGVGKTGKRWNQWLVCVWKLLALFIQSSLESSDVYCVERD